MWAWDVRLTHSPESAVASFFTPASKKEPEKVSWQERSANDDTPPTLLVGRYSPSKQPAQDRLAEKKRRKVAAFDLVSIIPGY